MAGKGRRFMFHGAFKSRRRALARKHKVKGFLKRVTVRGHTRWAVMSRR